MLGPAQTFARSLLRWYDRSRRDLPWRVPVGSTEKLDPYHVLVSEAMLQQTQVATVVPYYHRFLARFPTLADLAAADEQDVLRLWQGLGYYSRARNLQAAARKVVSDFGGELPSERDELLRLPGVGLYTAGAVASIAFGRRAPIVDGNVARVLCRVDRITTDPRERATLDVLWRRAEEVLPESRTGDFNSAMMELGATVCTPRSPQCLLCPVREHCEAFAAGEAERIPGAQGEAHAAVAPRDVLRPPGRCLADRAAPAARAVGRDVAIRDGRAPEPVVADGATVPAVTPPPPVPTTEPVSIGSVEHALTHRRYHFDVRSCDATDDRTPAGDRPRAWVSLDRLDDYPSRAHTCASRRCSAPPAGARAPRPRAVPPPGTRRRRSRFRATRTVRQYGSDARRFPSITSPPPPSGRPARGLPRVGRSYISFGPGPFAGTDDHGSTQPRGPDDRRRRRPGRPSAPAPPRCWACS